MKKSLTLSLYLCLSLVAAGFVEKDAADDANVTVTPERFSALKYRHIGPFRGGRVTAVAGVPQQTTTFYMGATGGGVWKTTDAGQSWNNISDGFFKAGSIGAIAVAPSDPNIVYVGTGSACPRGNVSPGIGMYRSTDAGDTWTHIGMEKAGQIGRIRVHPENPERVYAAVLGNVFGPNPERGVYRSLDGGKNWEKVLFASDKTGAVDLAMDSNNPRILYATMWRVERKPWTLIDGGEEGGVFKSVDGGDTWEKLTGGLPEGVLGRIGVTVSPANSKRLWVIVETTKEEEGGVYRSDDGGENFKRVNREHDLRSRAWYYNHIYADPKDENTVYVLNADFFRSIDGGESFESIDVPHGDNHDLWIHPENPRILINSNDGGANVSFNGGKTWSTQLNQPTAEFYRVSLDNQFPYRVYGAQQDNSTISVPSQTARDITPQQYWYSVGGGESGHIAVDPRHPNVVYAGNYIGQITRIDLSRGHMRDIVAYPQMHDGTAGRDIQYRFQWNAPIRLSPHDPGILYHCSQYVHRSTNEGQTWEVISPDLTTNNDAYHDIPGGPVQHDHTGVELYTTIFAFEESPLQPGHLWAGSDDGLLHYSPDAGKTWHNVTPQEMPAGGTVNTIELSRHDPGRVFVTVYRYRENDFQPYLFRTDDFGKSWRRLTGGNNGVPADHFLRVVREDPERKGLLYAGTEFGMYVSFDDGAHWQSLQLNLPVVPITDLAVHQGDLVVATQGRSFWILDDLGPLRELSPGDNESTAHLFQPRDAYRTQIRGFRGGDAPQSSPRGAVIRFYFAEKPASEVLLEILDEEGKQVRRFVSVAEKQQEDAVKEDEEKAEDGDKLEVKSGMSQLVWDLSYPAAEIVKGAVFSLSNPRRGPVAPPGRYQVRLTAGDWSQSRSFEIRRDPRWTVSDQDLKSQFQLAVEIRDQLTTIHNSIRKIRSLREQIRDLARRAVAAGHSEELKSQGESVAQELTGIEEKLIQTRSESSQDPINYPSQIDDQFSYLFGIVNSQDTRPTEGAYQRFEDLKRQLSGTLQALDNLIDSEVANFNALLKTRNVDPVVVPVFSQPGN